MLGMGIGPQLLETGVRLKPGAYRSAKRLEPRDVLTRCRALQDLDSVLPHTISETK